VIERPSDRVIGGDGTHLGPEPNAVRTIRVVQRLDTEVIPHQHQALEIVIPDGQGEHAVQPVDDVDAPLPVAVHDHLDVGAGRERVTETDQLGLEFPVVVDLSVAEDPDGTVLGAERLVTTVEVDDREAPEREPERPIALVASVIGTAMNDGIRHVDQELGVDRSTITSKLSRDTAHG